jgi:hypothetical protein
MFSVPPATINSASPQRIDWAASATARRPDPQTMLTASAVLSCGIPQPIATWRATFWPRPAEITLPIITSSTCSAAVPARSSNAETTTFPSCAAPTPASAPPNVPIAVLAAAAI